MPVFNDVGYGSAPTELWSGQPFSLSFHFAAWDSNLILPDEGIYFSQFGDLNHNVDHVTCSIMQGNRVVLGPISREVLHYTGPNPPHRWIGLIPTYQATWKEIEYFMGQALQGDQSLAVPFSLVLQFYGIIHLMPGGNQERGPYTEVFPFTWPLTIKIPPINVITTSYPSIVKKGVPFSIQNAVDFPYLPLDAIYDSCYIEAHCVGEDGIQREYIIWQDGLVQVYPNYDSKNIPSSIDIEQITGPLSIPVRHYDITIAIGYSAAGKIVDTDIPWQRPDEVRFTWPVDVVVGSPAPNFLPAPPSVYPPYSVKTTDLREVVLGIENYGAPGTIYIDCRGREVWRQALDYLGTDQWRSGQVSIDYFLGPITESGSYQIVFNCGYIDDSGNKVPVNNLTFTIYVIVPITPPGKVSLTISAGIGGTTNPSPGTYQYDQGKAVMVTIVPDEGYTFDHWEGTVVLPTPTDPEADFVIYSDGSLIAIFTPSSISPKKGTSWGLIGGIAAVVSLLGVVIYKGKRKHG